MKCIFGSVSLKTKDPLFVAGCTTEIELIDRIELVIQNVDVCRPSCLDSCNH